MDALIDSLHSHPEKAFPEHPWSSNLPQHADELGPAC